MAEPRPTLPSSSGDVQLRRMGLRKSNSAGPLRGQVVVLLVVVLIVLGVPLYLLRQPSLNEPSPAGSAEAKSAAASARSGNDAGVTKHKVTLGDVQRVKCSAGAAQRGNEGPACEPLPALEDLLKRAIRARADCAPQDGAGSINFVLNVDFPTQQANVFPGKSGTWKGPQAKRAAKCVEQALGPIKWDAIQHRYRFYSLAILASYPGRNALDMPTFE